jgi:ribonuclease inhibitor
MATVILDGRLIRTASDFHRQLSRLLDFGPYYGNNLDALWDRLSTDVERPVMLEWHYSDESRRNLGTQFDAIVAVLTDAKQQDADFGRIERFDFVLK